MTLRGHSGPVLSLSVIESLRTIVSGSSDTTIKIWDLDTGVCRQTLTGHTDAVTSLAADALGIVSGSFDRTIRAWSLAGRCHGTVTWHGSEGHTGVIRCVAASASRVVSASDDKTIKVWQRDSLTRVVTLKGHTDGVTCLAFNDFRIVSGSYDMTVKLWDFTVC